LEAVQLLECFVISPLNVRVVAEIAAKADDGVLVFDERLNDRRIRIQVPAGFAVMREHLLFDTAQAKDAPVADGDLIGEHVLDRVGGCEAAFKKCTQLLEFGGVFSREKNGVGGEPVAEGVEADRGATFRRFWAAFGSVTSIGPELAS
jgi:hypothetical protein